MVGGNGDNLNNNKKKKSKKKKKKNCHRVCQIHRLMFVLLQTVVVCLST